jgi:hypothetical protein
MKQREFLSKLHGAKDTLHDIYNSAALEGQYCTDTAHRLDDLITDLENLRDIAHNEEIEEEEL